MGKGNLLLFLFCFFVPALTHAFDRIVTLNPTVSEWTAEILGKDKALRKMVGASEYSNYPEYLKGITTVGPYPQVYPEKILSLKPDLVIASAEYNRPDQIEKLKKLNLHVEVLDKEHFLKMDEWILQLGKILGEEVSAQSAANQWKKSLEEMKPPKVSRKVFFQIQFQPLITAGGTGFLNDSFKKVGMENIFADIKQAYPKVSRESVLEKKPDIVLVFEMVKNHEDMSKIKAAWKASRVEVLNGDDFSRCSPRLLKALKGVK